MTQINAEEKKINQRKSARSAGNKKGKKFPQMTQINAEKGKNKSA